MKIEDLKLRKIDVLDSISLRSTSTSNGSSSGEDIGSHSGSWCYGSDSSGSDGSGSWDSITCKNCPADECQNHSDCVGRFGSGAFYKKDEYCGSNSHRYCTYHKCRAQTQNEKVCQGRVIGDTCYVDGKGGKCSDYGSGMVCTVGVNIPVKP